MTETTPSLSANSTIGLWTILHEKKETTGYKRNGFDCRCACGTTKWVAKSDLKQHKSRSCGCDRRIPVKIGDRFGHLTVVERSPVNSKEGFIRWKCLCDCGQMVNVTGQKLWRQGSNKRGHSFNLHCGQHGPSGLRYPPTEVPYPHGAARLLKRHRPRLKYLEHTPLYDCAIDLLIRACFIADWRSRNGNPVACQDSYVQSTLIYHRLRSHARRRWPHVRLTKNI